MKMALSSSSPCWCSSPPPLPPFIQRHRFVTFKPYARSQPHHTLAAAATRPSTPLVHATRQGFDTVNIAEDVTQVPSYFPSQFQRIATF